MTPEEHKAREGDSKAEMAVYRGLRRKQWQQENKKTTREILVLVVAMLFLVWVIGLFL